MSRKYLNWVKQLDCCVCGAPADDAHHIKGIWHLSSVGMKAPDWAVIPLCRKDHNEMHVNVEMWPDQSIYLARTLRRAFDEGKIRFT